MNLNAFEFNGFFLRETKNLFNLFVLSFSFNSFLLRIQPINRI